ncbi:glycerate kinase [Bacillus chungangensis]|uniref:Glycerate kinase n=1 Tax=Bacillus chungangensis TaxID=587633 RepID=A0ABT9WR44_9BACI|nr:glycerate kinase [Bacillus chungangensis]MDQ0175685.1 glycerate kinase [Bacillus chungangensis]
MKIVIAPDSFKESLTAREVAEAIEKGLASIFPEAEIVKIPMADGGEGTVQSLVDATNGKIIEKTVTGPMGTPVNAYFGLLGDGRTAVIEMAAASGLQLVPKEKRNPLYTTTFGTGELMTAALELGASELIIGLGGSATNDGGAGMAQALGVVFFDQYGKTLDMNGDSLIKIAKIDHSQLDRRFQDITIKVACDVNNPLIGVRGAAAVYSPQKGATPEIAKKLDVHLQHYAKMIEVYVKKDVRNFPGAGAAGGLAAGLMAFFSPVMMPGIDIVIEAANVEMYLKDAAFVVTGEGKMDGQTLYGKTPIGIARLAQKHDIPVIGITGSIGENIDVLFDYGFDAVLSIVPGPVTLDKAMANAEDYIVQTMANAARLMKLKI